jgi:hypothetical protein
VVSVPTPPGLKSPVDVDVAPVIVLPIPALEQGAALGPMPVPETDPGLRPGVAAVPMGIPVAPVGEPRLIPSGEVAPIPSGEVGPIAEPAPGVLVWAYPRP